MYGRFQEYLHHQLEEIQERGLTKRERIITSPQDAHIQVEASKQVLNLCANNYLGLAEHPEVLAAAHAGLDTWGYGLSSVRFICGTQAIHKQLESRLSQFLGTEETILYTSCFDANGGLFETLLTDQDAVISDALNHASIIDGIRLCKARRFRYRNNDMADLEMQLQEARQSRFRMIATDGVFSMDGYLANLPDICDLADKYEALVMVDDSHAVGFMGLRVEGHPSISRSWRVSTFSRELWGRRWGEPVGVTPAVAGRLLNYSGSVRALTCFRTRLRPLSSQPR
jgi:glycine C-acetyltransferase